MKKINTQELTLIGVLSAIILVMGFVPAVGYIPINPLVGFTIIHIPVLVGAYFGSRKVGGFLGLVFGLTSFIVALTRPSGALDPVFTNPLVSILPRFLFGFLAYDVLHFFKGKFSKSFIADALFFTTMTLIHSILVITLLYVAGINYWYLDVYGLNEALTREGTLGVIGWVSEYFIGGSSIFGFLISILIWNSLLETLVAAIVGTAVVDRLKAALTVE